MNWEELSAIEFANSIDTCESVCVIPIGVLERHGSHMPLGTDVFCAKKIVEMSAKITEVMVFPEYIFGQIPEATHEAGTVAIGLDLMVQLLDNVCCEISRNGFKKIVLFSAHGGNTFWRFFLARMLEKRRDFMCYYYFCTGDENAQKVTQEVCDLRGGWGEHAGGAETAIALHLFPELVKLENSLSESEGVAKTEHANHFAGSGVYSTIDWYAGHPTHIDGYHGSVTAEDGKKICDAIVSDFAVALEKIKSDNISFEKLQEFYTRSNK